MPLDVDLATDIARKHGLTLQDAQALSVLADNEDAADRLAQKFATPAAEPDGDAIATRILNRRGGGL